jgi:hypothetical protein
MSVTKTMCFIAMSKVLKSEIFRDFGPLIELGPHWINFIFLTFISENNRYFRCLYKIWKFFISFDMKNKGEIQNSKKKVKKKVNLDVLGVSF